MRKLLSEVPLLEIHIKLNKQSLSRLAKKEIMVLHQEAIVDSTRQLNIKIYHTVEPAHQELGHFRYWPEIAAAGIWTIAASLIASLIIELLVG